jgi:hypothetical protein
MAEISYASFSRRYYFLHHATLHSIFVSDIFIVCPSFSTFVAVAALIMCHATRPVSIRQRLRPRPRPLKLQQCLMSGLVLSIVLCCVHQSHQAENLSSKDGRNQLAGLVSHVTEETAGHGNHDHHDGDHVEGEHDHEHNHVHDHEEHDHDHTDRTGSCPPGQYEASNGTDANATLSCLPYGRVSDYKVWFAALGAILVISLCGIFGVLVIPIMQKIFYQHLIQFLIALAVGTLAGDALLHLLPHALLAGMNGHGHGHGDEGAELHTIAVWKGFVVLAALISFFIFEKVINAVGEWKERRKRRRNRRRISSIGRGESVAYKGAGVEKGKHVHIVKSGHAPSDKVVGETVCKHKYSSYCVSDVDPASNKGCSGVGGGTKCSDQHRNGSAVVRAVSSSTSSTPLIDAIAAPGTETELMPKNESGSFAPISEEAEESSVTVLSNSSPDKSVKGVNVDNGVAAASEMSFETVFIREHEHSHHGHSHAHSHIISKPESVSSVGTCLYARAIQNISH